MCASSSPAFHQRERLLDARMDVLSCDGTAGPYVRIDLQKLAFGVLGAYTNYYPFSGDRVLDRVSRL
jgi:hypothetical protein